MKKIILAASILALAISPAISESAPSPAKVASAPQMLPVTLTPEETAGVIALLGQMPTSQGSTLYTFFVAKEQAAQAAAAKK